MKCKEIWVCFLRDTPNLCQLKINDQYLQLVTFHKVLGLSIQNNLKQNIQIYDTVKTASKRLQILRVQRKAGNEIKNLVTIYIIKRLVVENCCVAWHHALPEYLSDELDRIQKRAMKITTPALSLLRNDLCTKTINKILKGSTLFEHLPKREVSTHKYNTTRTNNFTYSIITNLRKLFCNSFHMIQEIFNLLLLILYKIFKIAYSLFF